jgi:hypothetical protein
MIIKWVFKKVKKIKKKRHAGLGTPDKCKIKKN